MRELRFLVFGEASSWGTRIGCPRRYLAMCAQSSNARPAVRRDPPSSGQVSVPAGTSSGRSNSAIPGDSAHRKQFPGSLPDGGTGPEATTGPSPQGGFAPNLFSEVLITLGAATKFCPRRRAGRKVHSSTVSALLGNLPCRAGRIRFLVQCNRHYRKCQDRVCCVPCSALWP